MSFVGNLCMESPQAFSLDFVNFSYVNPTEPSDFTMNLSLDLSAVQYDQNGYLVASTLLLDGSMNGTVDGIPGNLDFIDWTSALSGIVYDTDDNIIEMTVTVDGSVTGNIDGDPLDENYDDLAFWFQKTTIDSVKGELFTINGKYDGACTNGWATIETLVRAFLPHLDDACSTQGRFKISGAGEATVTCNEDGSVTIDADGEQVDYSTCDDLEICV